MPIPIQVKSKGLQALTDRLDRIGGQLDDRGRTGLMKVLGKGMEGDLRGHFIRRNKKPNKRGFAKSHFWREIAHSTHLLSADRDTATVTISDRRINPHLFGGTIRPRTAKMLAIPASEEAQGQEPRGGGIPGLFLANSAKRRAAGKPPFLATESATVGQLEVHYWLTPQVRIPKDPETLPADKALADQAATRGSRWLDRRKL